MARALRELLRPKALPSPGSFAPGDLCRVALPDTGTEFGLPFRGGKAPQKLGKWKVSSGDDHLNDAVRVGALEILNG